MDSETFKSVLDALLTYAAIGQAAMLGMFISGILIVMNLLGAGIAQPLIGFITVPLACLWFGWKEIRKAKNG